MEELIDQTEDKVNDLEEYLSLNTNRELRQYKINEQILVKELLMTQSSYKEILNKLYKQETEYKDEVSNLKAYYEEQLKTLNDQLTKLEVMSELSIGRSK